MRTCVFSSQFHSLQFLQAKDLAISHYKSIIRSLNGIIYLKSFYSKQISKSLILLLRFPDICLDDYIPNILCLKEASL